ncbi:NAD(P)H-dependent oxidoreductase [Mucilaginibacter corticis]|uniref:NAD(P)H-dependent oxidoreductase n=1 Tax=Mucilaginibacter corticis TaxID=2597670 RepID=A0A556MUJ2_9SPHI|nr:NAD(P)H-dependent oxidoreductase [Mucilaginibacter corticis]TSJ43468.1 NAD(P)H-dependent oxidoreductase [Mucilaginibacter corticis]
MSLLDKLNWRYATKKFDENKKISPEQLYELLSAVQLAPSSAGLQAYRIIVVENPEVKQKLREAARGQQQLTTASHVIVFAAETNLDSEYVKNYIDRIAATRGVDRANLEAFEKNITHNINLMTEDVKIVWNHKQSYIALGVLLSAAADLGIDACPMEGFEAGSFDEILGLKALGLTTSVIAPIGFRAEDDHLSKAAKVRRPKEELFIHV